MRSFTLLAAALCLVLAKSALSAEEFTEDFERDLSLRSIGQFQITNLRGSITVRGWALDKIRVKARRKAKADTLEQARKLFGSLDVRYLNEDGNIELSAEYGRGLTIEDRLKERESPQTAMDMEISAPSRLKLRVLAIDGQATVKQWNAPLEVRTNSGAIQVESIKADTVSLLCPACSIRAKAIKSSLRCMGGKGSVELSDVTGSQVYVESETGALRLFKIKGDQLYVSKTGLLFGRDLRGHIEFHTQNSNVDFQEVYGFASGRSDAGNVSLSLREWKWDDKAFIESNHGSIAVVLPYQFSGDLDVWSTTGKTEIALPIEKVETSNSVGPEPANHIVGHVGDGGETLKIFSENGDIKITRHK